jgi:hypothetical protein
MPLRAHHYIAQNAGNNFPDLTVTGATSFQTLSAARIVTSAAGSNLADLTCGPTNFTAGVRCTAGGISTDRVTNNDITSGWNMFSTAPMYPGRLDTGWTTQTSWYLASHGAYGLYTNTGMYYEGGVNFPSFTSRGAGNIAGGLTISSGGIDATGYSYIRTPGGSGDASLFLMNPAAGGATQNFRLMSYAGVFRIWNGDNSVELFTLGGAGNAGFAGSLTLGASGSLREYGRSIPNGVAQIVQAADYVHGQMYNVTGQVTVSTIGKTINMTFCINGNFTSGASVNMTIPFGFLPASSLHIPVSVNHGWEAWHHGICAISNGQYYVTFYDVHLNAMPDNGALWLYGSVTFPIQ